MTSKRIAFFGATGGEYHFPPTTSMLMVMSGCTLAALWRALGAGHHCRALVRSPEKLRNLLKKHRLDEASNLEIVKGDVTDTRAVLETLRFSGGAVEIILCGIGKSFTLFHTTTDSY
jgi:hypothetical protein